MLYTFSIAFLYSSVILLLFIFLDKGIYFNGSSSFLPKSTVLAHNLTDSSTYINYSNSFFYNSLKLKLGSEDENEYFNNDLYILC